MAIATGEPVMGGPTMMETERPYDRVAACGDSKIVASLMAEKIEAALDAFDQAITAHDFLEIDGVIYAGEEFAGKKFEKDALKIDNHRMKSSYAIEVQAVVEQYLPSVMEALETGVWEKLYGITRIVGYYSRTTNWNKSKLGELRDRHRGNYSVSAVGK